MERLNIARLKALEERARSKSTPREGDIISPIIEDLNNVAEINYSVVAVGAEFRTQNQVVKMLAKNNPNSVRPKAPTNKMKRQDKVLPFPQRRLEAIRQEF